MFVLLFVFLAICILFVMADSFVNGMVLAALLAVIWRYTIVLDALKKKMSGLERDLSHMKAKRKQSELDQTPAQSENIASEKSLSKVNSDILDDNRPIESEVPAKIELAPTQPVVHTAKDYSSQQPTLSRQSERKITDAPHSISESTSKAIATPTRQNPVKREPSFINKIIQAGWHWLTSGNVFVRLGIIVLFIGVTFLLHYAVEQNFIPIELRLSGVAFTGIALLYWGWTQRIKKRNFSLVIQGGGIGLLYLTVFASYNFYHVIPALPAFILIALVVLFAAILAVLQDAKSLAVFATVGGFFAPILTSSGSNNYIGLFSYYTALNLGIFAIAWFKSWRILNLLGFVFTFSISTIWGVLSYQPDFFATTEPFLIIFFLLYVCIAVLFSIQRQTNFRDYVDSSLVFGTPILAFGLQCAMVKHFDYGIAISAVSLGGFYLILSKILWVKYGQRLRLLSEVFLSLGVIFITLAIPFAIDGTLTGATWAIEGAGILWVSIKQQQKYRRLFGIGLILLSGLMLASELVFPLFEPRPVFDHIFLNSVFIGCVLIAVSSSVASFLLSRNFEGKKPFESTLSSGLLVYGLVVLLAGFEYQIADFNAYQQHGVWLAVLCSICIVGFTRWGASMNWTAALKVSVFFIFPLTVAAILSFAYQERLASDYGYIIWPIALFSYFYSLKMTVSILKRTYSLFNHVLATVVIIGLLFWEGVWQLLACFSIIAVLFDVIGTRQKWDQLRLMSLSFLPVLVLAAITAIVRDGDLIRLSSIASLHHWSFPPGYLLWPISFSVYYFLLFKNQTIGQLNTQYFHYSGGILVGLLLLWLGLWPLLLGASLLCLLAHFLSVRFNWGAMHRTALALLPIMLLVCFIKFIDSNFDPFYLQGFNLDITITMESGYLLWPLAFACLFLMLYQNDRKKRNYPHLLHSIALLLGILLMTWEASWHILDIVSLTSGWHLAWLPITSLIGIGLIRTKPFWPFSQHRESFEQFALIPLLVSMGLWSVFQLRSAADVQPLTWLPLLNPIDLVQSMIIVTLLFWIRSITPRVKEKELIKLLQWSIFGYVFVWANIDLLRAIHHWTGIDWSIPLLLKSNLSQSALSIFWTLWGLAITLFASKRNERATWIIGASLLGIVSIKLFLVDFAASNTIERIVSFTAVGLLLVLVGYFSPIPPKSIESKG